MYDVIVVGLGAMGSAAAYHLAKRGAFTLGLDRFNPPHVFGSSHGHTRIFRQAYFEGDAYVPMAKRAFELWKNIEEETGQTLLKETGVLNIGSIDSQIVTNTIESAKKYGLDYEILTPQRVAERYPAFNLRENDVAVLEKAGGALFPEICVEVQLDLAARYGLELRINEPMMKWKQEKGYIKVYTQHDTYLAKQIILSAGSWNARMFGFSIPLEVERKIPTWFQPITNHEIFAPENFPAFVWHDADDRTLYGLPGFNEEGTKISIHQGGLTGRVEELPKQASINEIKNVQDIVRSRFPHLNTHSVHLDTCLYTNTPDGHFVLGQHPEVENVKIAGGFSGHGFKFATVIGEILADLVTINRTNHDISMFSPTRFSYTNMKM